MAARAKRPRDPFQLAKLIGDISTGQVEDEDPTKGKNEIGQSDDLRVFVIRAENGVAGEVEPAHVLGKGFIGRRAAEALSTVVWRKGEIEAADGPPLEYFQRPDSHQINLPWQFPFRTSYFILVRCTIAHYIMTNITKTDGKIAGALAVGENNYCVAPLLVVPFVCGISPPPPLESRFLSR